MSHASDHEADTWSRVLGMLILGFVCYALPWSVFAALPIPEGNAPLLRIQGSNTIGARLAPALVEGLMRQQGLLMVRSQPGPAENEQRISARTAEGREVHVDIAAHGSSTGFVALQQGRAELAASSRPIKDSEVAALAELGDLRSRSAEQVIGIDGLAILVHPDNGLKSLTSEQLAKVFAGEIRDWAALGGKAGAIHLYARDDKSGTFDTFKELVLVANGKALAPDAARFESSDQLSETVAGDPQGIGFAGLASVGRAKTLAISAGESQPMAPSTSLIATEDYPLSRRLFLYNAPEQNNPWVLALVAFAHSAAGQAIVAKVGFVAQDVRAMQVATAPGMPQEYSQLANEAQRLSVNFRFQHGSARLDNKAQRDIDRVTEYLRQNDKLYKRTVLVGFADDKADPQRASLLSKLRAMAVRRELSKAGVIFRDVTGLGDEMPVAANSLDEGRIKNRRVEVWVY